MFIALALGSTFSISAQNSKFLDFVKHRVALESSPQASPSVSISAICAIEKDILARRVFFEYGSIFVSTRDVRLPNACIFSSAAEVDTFQARLSIRKHSFDGVSIELQRAAMEELVKARSEALEAGLNITPLDGSIAGRRSYEDTLRIWNSRFYRALDYWVRRGKIAADEAESVRNSPISVQIGRVMEWEKQGSYFSTNFSKSIFYSVAPPGTSQHLSLLAFDVVEASNSRVRKIMNKHGWYQTIRTDQPHFTYLGVPETDLPDRGLRNIIHEGNSYWVPSNEIAPNTTITITIPK